MKIYVLYQLGRYVEDAPIESGIYSSKRKAMKEFKRRLHATDYSYYLQGYRKRKGEFIPSKCWGLENYGDYTI